MEFAKNNLKAAELIRGTAEQIRRAVAKYIVKEAFGFGDHFQTMGLIFKPAKTK